MPPRGWGYRSPPGLYVHITTSGQSVIKCDKGIFPLHAAPNTSACRAPRPARAAIFWQTCGVRVYLGSDHAGYELKAALVAALEKAGHEPVDCGPHSYDANDDYPVYVLRAAQGVTGDPGSLGIVIGGSGNGEQIASNKVAGIRAAVAWTLETATLARQHNDANVLSLGARQYSVDEAISFALAFVATPFSEDPRHVRRLSMVADYEKSGAVPPLP
jgi:ribose 5-phosphate isomerase B